MNHDMKTYRRALGAVVLAAATATPALAADKSFLVANGAWGTATNWNPLGAPTAADNAYIGNTAGAVNGTVSLGSNANAFSLVVTDGMTLRTQLWGMTVTGVTSLAGQNGLFRSTVMVDNGVNAVDFRTNALVIDDGAELRLNSGSTTRVDGLFDLQTDGRLAGSGVINFYRNGLDPAFRANGYIVPGTSGLTLNQMGTARLDLDGTLEGDRTINVTGTTGLSHASLTVNGTSLYDAFGDRLLLGRGNVANMNLSSGWTLAPSGVVQFQHDPARTGPGVLNGGIVTISGDMTVDASAHGQVGAAAVIQSNAQVTVNAGGVLEFVGATTVNGGTFSIPSNGTINFEGPTVVAGGNFNALLGNGSSRVRMNGPTDFRGNITSTGIWSQNADATVSQATTINAQQFDMDGANGSSNWTINAPFTLNASTIDPGDQILQPSFTVNGQNLLSPGYAEINVTSPSGWAIGGSLNLNGPGGGLVATTLRGSPVRVFGDANISGGNISTAKWDMRTNAVVTINAASSLRLDGGSIADPNLLDGGSIVGAGTLRSTNGHALVGHGTIATSIAFTGNAELRADGGILQVAGAIVDVGIIGTASQTGVLVVTNPWDTSVANRVELLGGSLAGDTVTNGGVIAGHGTVAPSSLSNNGTIAAEGGELVINPIGSLDLDGTSGLAQLHAVQGNLTIVDDLTDNFDGDAFVGPGRTMTFQSGWHTNAAATVSLTGTPGSPAVIAGDGQSFFGSTVTVSGPARFDLMTLFSGGTDVQTSAAGDSLTSTQDAFVSAGANFTGPGELRNATTGSLQLGEGANVGIRLVNGGVMGIDFSNQTGIASVQQFEQTAIGSLQIDLAGTVPGNDFDRLNVAQDAQLAGRLELARLGLYVPDYLQPHEVLRADSISGHFDMVPDNKIAADKYWAVTYDADSVFATAALPGDADLNGVVDFADLLAVAQNYGPASGHVWAEGDFTGNGQVGFEDLLLLSQNYGVALIASDAGVGSGIDFHADWAMASTLVPEPSTLAVVVAAGLVGLRRRRPGPVIADGTIEPHLADTGER